MGALTDPITLTRGGEVIIVRHFDSDTECIIVHGENWNPDQKFDLRIHSSCLFGEAFDTDDCDCGKQLSTFLDAMKGKDCLLIYCYEEGRGAGLRQKCNAIRLQQDSGLNTAEAFAELGLHSDLRSFQTAADALLELGVKNTVRLVSNNRLKIQALERAGYKVIRVHQHVQRTEEQESYLDEKRRCLGHLPEE